MEWFEQSNVSIDEMVTYNLPFMGAIGIDNREGIWQGLKFFFPETIMLSIQQQQHSLLSQASWGRLEMKSIRNTKAPTETQKEHKAKGRERDKQNEEKGHGSGTSIASLQALLSIASSLEIFHSFKSLLTDSSQVKLGRPLPLFTLSSRFRTPLHTGTSGGLRWTTIMLSIYKLICL